VLSQHVVASVAAVGVPCFAGVPSAAVIHCSRLPAKPFLILLPAVTIYCNVLEQNIFLAVLGWWYAAGKNTRFSYQNVLFCARTFCTVHKQNVLFCTLSSKKTIYLIFKVPKLSFISTKPIHSHVTLQGLSHDAKIFQIGQIKRSIICRT
jgi:hypothetical protein